MKFICDKNLLSDAVLTCQKAVSSKSTLPILEGILIDAYGENVKLTSNDLEMCIEYNLAAQISKEGSIVLNARMLGDIVRKLPSDLVLIETNEKGIVLIKSGNASFDISGLSSSEFPKVPEINKEYNITLEEKTLKSMIRQTIFSIAITDNKPILTGSFFDLQSDILTMVAVDGYRLAIRKEKVENSKKDIKTVVPGKTMGELLKILKDSDSEVNIYFSEKHVLFEFEGFMVISRTMEGEYINYKSIIPSSFNTNLIAGVLDFCDSIERAALIINADNSKSPIKMSVYNDRVEVNCVTQTGKVSDIIKVNGSGEELEIGFNYKYLLDAFRACDDEHVKVCLNSPLNPCVLEPLEGDSFLYMVLPVRLVSN